MFIRIQDTFINKKEILTIGLEEAKENGYKAKIIITLKNNSQEDFLYESHSAARGTFAYLEEELL